MFRVITSSNCKWCEKSKALLSANGLSFIEVPLVGQAWLRELMAQANLKTVPQIFKPDGDLVGGYEDLVKYLEQDW